MNKIQMNVSQTDYKSNIMPGTGQIGQGYTQLPIHIIARPQSRFCVYNSAPVRGNIASAPRKPELHRGLAGAGTWLDGPGTGRSRVGGSRDASDHTSLGAHGPVTGSQPAGREQWTRTGVPDRDLSIQWTAQPVSSKFSPRRPID